MIAQEKPKHKPIIRGYKIKLTELTEIDYSCNLPVKIKKFKNNYYCSNKFYCLKEYCQFNPIKDGKEIRRYLTQEVITAQA